MVRFRAYVSRPDTSPNRRSAFTLIEIMVALALFAIVMATVGPNMRRSSASTKGAALALAAALTEARQQAITQQVPVALVIPSGSGSQGQANSYYIAAGDQPRVTQVKRLGGEQSDLRLMVGDWPLDTSKLTEPTLTTTITPPPEATWENDFNLNQWGLPAAKDYAFIFTPRGKLLTNDLPHFDGAYHLVVSHGGRSTPASVPGTGVMTTKPTLHNLTQVGTPYTVTIDPAGAVSVTPGLIAMAASGVAVKDQAAMSASPNPPALSPPPGRAPVIRSVTLLPDPAKLKLPTGVNMLVAPGRHISLTVRAKSPEKVPLFCQWTAERGGLSSPEKVRMTYLPSTAEWEGVWQWQPPAEAVAGEKIRIRGKVLDRQGHEVPVSISSTIDPVIQVGDDTSRIAFVSNRNAKQEIYVMNADGSGLNQLSDVPGNHVKPVWSPDGNQVAFEQQIGTNYEMCVMYADGSGQTNLTNTPGYEFSPVWSPSGTQIAFNRDPGEVWVMNADGSAQRKLAAQAGIVGWSPDGKRIAFTTNRDGNYEIYTMKPDGSDQRNLTNNPARDVVPAWSPDGGQIAFTTNRDGTTSSEVYVMNADGSDPRNLTNRPGQDDFPVWSPDGNQIAFVSNGGGDTEVFVMNKDGSGRTNLSGYNRGQDAAPVWSPDGRIAFRSERGYPYEVMIVNADGSGLQNISKAPAFSNFGADWR